VFTCEHSIHAAATHVLGVEGAEVQPRHDAGHPVPGLHGVRAMSPRAGRRLLYYRVGMYAGLALVALAIVGEWLGWWAG
jgi:hypothetical protein